MNQRFCTGWLDRAQSLRTLTARLLLTMMLSTAASADTATPVLFGVISERNSASAAAAAGRFREEFPNAEIVLRTPQQLSMLPDAVINDYLQRATAVLVAGVFSDDAARLARLIDGVSESKPVIVVSSSRELVLKSQTNDGWVASSEAIDAAVADPSTTTWGRAHAYWQARGPENLSALFAYLISSAEQRSQLPAPEPLAPVRYAGRRGLANAPMVVLLDYETGDQTGNVDLHDSLCAALVAESLACQSVFADWGEFTAKALEDLTEQAPAAVVMLQDFALGGAERERADAAVAALGVPLVKAIRLQELSPEQWQQSQDGLPTDSVYYRVAMPELSGAGQGVVLAAAARVQLDSVSGIAIKVTTPIETEIRSTAKRLAAWQELQQVVNSDKRIAIIYYNHPPGRHNIGADNLDVPATLFTLLERLQAEGYETGQLPESKEALLELIQSRAVNLPENNAALQDMAGKAFTLSNNDYAAFFESLPLNVQKEMTDGPLAALQADVDEFLNRQMPETARSRLTRALKDLAYVIEGAPVERHARAEDLIDQLEAAYTQHIEGSDQSASIKSLSDALRHHGIEGLRGWGPPPGRVMTVDGQFVFPGIRFGNVFIGPQPPRGWEINEEVLHANMSVAPPHQYLAFYEWLRRDLDPHAIIHLGRHSTYEFLPGPRTGLTRFDYSRIVAAETPGLYPYIVDGVGEGLQAKRRGLAVIVDHLTPALQATPFYDELLQLRQLVEGFEAADPSQSGEATRVQAFERIKRQVIELGIEDALVAELEAEHGGGERMVFDEIEPGLLVHEVGHFLTGMQEDFMPLGLHVFGQPWSEEAIETMLTSMAAPDAEVALRASPEAEMRALLAGLEGKFVEPGKGNDPLRSPDALPTGRNFYGFDASLIPNSVAYGLGSDLARDTPVTDGHQAVVLWASDTVRDGGVMVSFGLRQMGVRPTWNSRGIVRGLERLPLGDNEIRQDVTFVASGLFRDLYGEQMKWVDKAVLLALDGASETIKAEYPQLSMSLEAVLAPLAELRAPGRDPLAQNAIAQSWVEQMLEGVPSDAAARTATLRVFAPAIGQYGAGINRLAERSGAWSDRQQLAATYVARMGHAYGVDVNGSSEQDAFASRLKRTDQSFLGRASNLYGLVDNNDAFDYLGGLNLAIEVAGGEAPTGFVVDVSNPEKPTMPSLERAIVSELRGRQLNPAWIASLMPHGYAGARTMNVAYFENLWGWEVTDPDLFPDTIWEDTKAIYLDDRYNIGVSEFLDEEANLPVQANMIAIMLVAAQKGYWQTSAETITVLGERFAVAVASAGLPGSGHTQPDHPMLDWIAERVSTQARDAIESARAAARGSASAAVADAPPQSIRELIPDASAEDSQLSSSLVWFVVLFAALVISSGIVRGRVSA
ncbi:MAG: cobaltochelatase subunit CobN [Pseudomonadota bacterium]